MNLAVQITAFAVSAAASMWWGGIMSMFFVLTVVPLLVVLMPTVLAVGVYPRQRLERAVWLPFMGMAGSMVVTSLALLAGWNGLSGAIGLLGMVWFLVLLGGTAFAISRTSGSPVRT